jgi:hypothetical protein
MALCASGEMSLGGSTTGRSVNLELGRSATAGICMNETGVRTLAAVPSGAISMNCFYGKSSAPTTLGQVFEGGYYTGVVDIGGGVCYYMLVSPNATGCAAACQWKTTRTITASTCSTTNGYLNTFGAMQNATHPAGNWTATRSINGYSDWYLPALSETGTMYTNKGSMPAGEGFPTSGYWSSTELNSTIAWVRCFFNGTGLTDSIFKTLFYRVRALRRSRI